MKFIEVRRYRRLDNSPYAMMVAATDDGREFVIADTHPKEWKEWTTERRGEFAPRPDVTMAWEDYHAALK